MRRSGKWYRKNEEEVMRQLGLEPTPGSGCGSIWKEDGQSEDVICQLKSTDKQSIRVQKQDIDTLLYNAAVAHKLPVFALQFIQSQEVYLLVRPEDLVEITSYIQTGNTPVKTEIQGVLETELVAPTEPQEVAPKVRSCSASREEYAAALSDRYKRKSKSAL